MEGTVEVRAEDADILILLVYHYDDKIHNLLFFTTSKGSFCIDEIVKSLPDHKKKYILMCHSFTGCDTVSSFYGFSKEKLFERICNGNLDPILDVFYNEKSTHDQIRDAGIQIIQFVYKSQGISLATLRFNIYNKQSKAGVLNPKSLPPTNCAAEQHSLRSYLQLQDWLSLQNMSRDPRQFGWYEKFGRYEPIPTTAAVAPPNLLKFVSCNCSCDCNTRRCSCRKNNVKCISACGKCHGKECNNIELEIINDE